MSTRTAIKPAPGYEDDFYAWTQDQAAKLRARSANEVDWENAAEEIESLGRSDRRSIANILNVVLVHLLKWIYQQDHRKGGWMASIIEHRDRLRRILNDSPSLRSYPADILGEEYASARRIAAAETELPLRVFPETCPFTVEEALDPGFPADLQQESPE